MKILIATDAWSPQINGVLATYNRLAAEAPRLGVRIAFLTPEDFSTVALPGYPEIEVAIPNAKRAELRIKEIGPDHIHIATEGPVGWMARAYCRKRRLPFTTSFHTRFPEYLAAHMAVPRVWTYAALRRFHRPSAGMMVATPSLRRELAARGFQSPLPWTRGVDTDLFRPRPQRLFGTEGPVFLYVGRVSREKNIEAFLNADVPGIKAVVGDGPHLSYLQERYPHVRFAGRRLGEDLANHYASADVFVFPSRTDTFGLVILEALASGLPVAAYPVTGPKDILEHGISGYLDQNLSVAMVGALRLDRRNARARAENFTWRRTAEMFLSNVHEARAALHGAPQPAMLSRKAHSSQHQTCGPAALRRS